MKIRLVYAYTDTGNAPLDAKEVIAAANKVSKERIGVTVDLEFQPEEKLNLMMASGERYDMVFSSFFVNNFDRNAKAGLYYDLTDLIRTETPALFESIGKYWDCTTVDGRIYGVPVLKDMGTEELARFNADYFEGEKGMEIPERLPGLKALEPYLKDGTVLQTQTGSDRYYVRLYQTGSVVNASVQSVSRELLSDRDQWDAVFEEYETDGIYSRTEGFSYDITRKEDIITALQAIYSDYAAELRTGTSDPDVVAPVIKKRMEAAGINEVLDDIQDQLNEWFHDSRIGAGR